MQIIVMVLILCCFCLLLIHLSLSLLLSRFVQRGGAGQLGSGAHESHLPLVGNQAAFKNHSHSDSCARRFASMPSLCVLAPKKISPLSSFPCQLLFFTLL